MFSLETLIPLIAGGIHAPEIPALGWISNSIFVAVLVTVGVLLFTRMATKRMELIPGPKQNFVRVCWCAALRPSRRHRWEKCRSEGVSALGDHVYLYSCFELVRASSRGRDDRVW